MLLKRGAVLCRGTSPLHSRVRMGEGQTNITATLELLQDLQDLDRSLYQARDEIRRLPAERDKRRGKIDDRLQILKEAGAAIHTIEVQIKEIEDATSSQRQRMRKLEGEATSAKVDTAMLVAYQHEIRSLRKYIGQAESEGLELVEVLEMKTTVRDTLKESVDLEETSFVEYSTNVDAELLIAEEKRGELEQQRTKRIKGRIDLEILREYEKLLEAREGQALAELDRRVCQGCFVTVPQNLYVKLAMARSLVECPSCNRIFFIKKTVEKA